MKYCPKCKEEKEDAEFYADSNRKDGLSGWCKCCFRAKLKAKYLADGRPGRTTDIVKPRRIAAKERYRHEQVVKYGLAVVEAIEALNDC